jgi:hypothetical protein
MEPTKIPNNPHLEFRLLEECDYNDLNIFCNRCKELRIVNNESFKSIKLDQIKMPYGQYFIGYDYNKKQIWNIAGVHKLPEISSKAWRCLFRGAQLPGYGMGKSLTRDFFKSGYQMSYVLDWQVQFILNNNPLAEFYTSTNNLKNKKYFSRSQFLDQIAMPMMEKRGVFTRIYDDFELYNTRQSIWKLHLDQYYEERKKSIGF